MTHTVSDTGYVQEIPFQSGVVAEQTPAVLRYVALQAGYLPPDDQQPFTYLDLGCGDGTTLLALAHLYPYASFYGIDFNPLHVAQAQEDAQQLALTNVSFFQAPFSAMDALGELPATFDFITINGIYGWLAPQEAAAVDAFVAKRLAPGGIFYAEYLSSPGKIAIAELWRFLQELCPLSDYNNDPRQRAEAALDTLERLAKRGLFFLAEHPTALRAAQHYLQARRRDRYQIDHFAHNAMAAHFTPRRFTEIHRRLSASGLYYAGSTRLPLNDPELAVPPMQQPTLREITDPARREMVKDFIRNEHDRRDVWVHQATCHNPTKASELLAASFGLLARNSSDQLVRSLQTVGNHRLPLTGPIYDTLIAAATDTGAWLPKVAPVQECTALSWRRAFDRLAASGQYLVLTDPHFVPNSPLAVDHLLRQPLTITDPFNRWQLDRVADRSHGAALVAAPCRGVAVALSSIEALLLKFANDRTLPLTEAVEPVLAHLAQRDPDLHLSTADGVLPVRKITREVVEKVRDTLLKPRLFNLYRLGLIAC